MKLLAYFRSLAARFFQRSEIEDDMEAELHSHIQLRADDLERSGLKRAEAQRRARIEFGGRERFKEEAREAFVGNFIETFFRDVRFSFRLLRKSPGFTSVAVFTLAVAIGANAVVFGVLNGLILRPLDVPQPENLYGIEHANEHNMYESYPDYLDLRDRNRSFDGLAGFFITQVGLDTGDNPSSAWVYETSGNYFDELRIQPYLGRVFHGSDEHGPNSAPYLVLSHAYWHLHFHDDPGVVGRTVGVNKHPFIVIGVAPPQFQGTLVFGTPDFFVPLVNQEQVEGRNVLNARATSSVFMALGHLKPGVTLDQAAADLNSIGAYLEKTYPTDHGATTFVLARPNLYGNLMGGPMRAFVSALMLLAGLILLAACANLGSLFAARAADRSREVALRLALGASRSRILRQLLTEAMLIALGGGALGLWGSILLLRALSVWHPISKFPMTVPVSPDANVYIVALVLALVSGLLFGIVPVRQVLRTDPYQIVKAGPSGTNISSGPKDYGSGPPVSRPSRDLRRVGHRIVGCGARAGALAGQQFRLSAAQCDAGRDRIGHGRLSRRSGARHAKAHDRFRGGDSGRGVRGIDRPDAALWGWVRAAIFTDRTTDLRPSNAVVTAIRYNISPEYLHAAGTVLLAGRGFSWHDDKGSPRVAVVNREFARKIFGSTSQAVGRSFKLRDGTRIQVVGVVEDGKYENLTEDPESALFLPILQAPIE